MDLVNLILLQRDERRDWRAKLSELKNILRDEGIELTPGVPFGILIGRCRNEETRIRYMRESTSPSPLTTTLLILSSCLKVGITVLATAF